MGLWDAAKGQARSVIEWENPNPDMLFELWATDGDEIKNASKLIVKPGQGVIFLYEGSIEAVHLSDGLYNLETDNIPFLTTLTKFMQKFESEHKVGIYFFWLTEFVNQKWGTSAPVKYDDPVYNFPVGLRAFGNMSFKITDPRHFFENIVGSRPRFSLNDARRVIVDRLMQQLTDVLAEAGHSYAEVDKNRNELSSLLVENVSAEFGKLGFALTDFRIENTDFDDDTKRRIDRIADMTAEAEAARRAGINYAQMQQLDALRDAAKNPGGGAGVGVGLGAGVGLGQAMAQSLAGDGNPAQSAPAAAGSGDPSERLKKLKGLLDAGLISEEDFAAKKQEILKDI